ncbi:HAMP domain-containing histidine kinase [Desulfuribacillus stibiiarsenatis]|nr:HAMP domain-containing histidine kinase [Desulfuribacillus stibiiarsenatis]
MARAVSDYNFMLSNGLLFSRIISNAGLLLTAPTISLIIYFIIAETSSKHLLILGVKRFVQAHYYWAFIVFINTFALTDKNIQLLFVAHFLVHILVAIILIVVVKYLNNFYLKELLSPFSYGILAYTFIEIFAYQRLSEYLIAIMSSIVFTLFLVFAVLMAYERTNRDYKNFLSKFFVDNSLNLYSTEFMHEIKNNLGVIKGFSDLINRSCKTIEVAGVNHIPLFVQEINTAVDNMDGFIKEFKDYANTKENNLREEDIRQLIEKVYYQFYNRGNVRITINSDTKIFAWVNRFFLKQILFNIIKNAAEEAGRQDLSFCEINFSLYYRERYTYIDIFDSCNQIKKEYAEDILKIFKSSKEDGFRIGLVASKKLAIYQFGNLTIEEVNGNNIIRLIFRRSDIGEMEIENIHNGR